MIYVLELENGKYYVGYSEKTDNTRINQHFNGQGSEWCKRYKPIKVIGTYDGCLYEENKKTIELMQLYGYNNVRGGKWVLAQDYKSPPKELISKVFDTKNENNIDSDGDVIMF
uniref:GIY-YIG domain-containing protein n=1 Tax=viral metagenome TaxID=1070528 RepID=A0A6C0LYH9_9ZZZZ